MKTGNRLRVCIPAVLGLLVLILDNKTGLEGATAGLQVCLQTVIPSLFPFIFLSSLLTSALTEGSYSHSNVLCRLFRMPSGCGGLLLTGLLGGYPVGARCVGEAVANGQLSQSCGERLLVFCNAAGPAFLFGITGSLFPQRWVAWGLWGIHLFSAFSISRLLPANQGQFIPSRNNKPYTIIQRLRQCIQVMAEICAWIILMRIAISILRKWFLMRLPLPLQILITGLLELSNGCLSLIEIDSIGLRFILCSVFLAFGGLCVTLQTSSAAAGLSMKGYLPGKLTQSLVSFLVSYLVQYIAFGQSERVSLLWLFLSAFVAFLLITSYCIMRSKKSCGNFQQVGV